MKKIAALLLLGLAACAGETVLPDKQYAENAKKAMQEESYDFAIQQYQTLLEEYPFSDYSEEAQLKIGQAQYMNEQYAEAIASFQDFQRMHPTNPNIAVTEYYTALAYMDQMGAKDRDQKAADNAQAHLHSVIERHPESPFVAEARQKLKECRTVLADHELTIAKFYLTWGNPVGAEARLRYLLENYTDTDVAGQALAYFASYFRKRGDLTRSALAYASLISQYPQNPDISKATEEIEDLKQKQITTPEAPLPALVESLGRPSLAAAAKPAEVKPETAAKPDTGSQQPPPVAPDSPAASALPGTEEPAEHAQASDSAPVRN
ncbi:MAG: outer membrane protein assembly factor BamD [Candidatus Binatia bacterium]